MFFLEKKRYITKSLKGVAGLANSKCVMPFHTFEWKQVAACEEKEPLLNCIADLPYEKKQEFRIISNELFDDDFILV